MYLFERGGDSRGLRGTEISYAGLLSKWLQQPGLDQAVVISLEFSLGLSAERLCHFNYHCYFPGCMLPAGWDGKQSQDWNPRPSNRGCRCLYCHPTCLLQNCLSLKGSCQLSSCDWSFTVVGNSWWGWGVEGYRSTGMIVSVHEEKIFPPLKSRLSYLKGRVIERDREGEIFHLLSHSAKGHSCQSQASSQSSRWVTGVQALGPLPLLSQVHW